MQALKMLLLLPLLLPEVLLLLRPLRSLVSCPAGLVKSELLHLLVVPEVSNVRAKQLPDSLHGQLLPLLLLVGTAAVTAVDAAAD
jgi:hypothetical protein